MPSSTHRIIDPSDDFTNDLIIAGKNPFEGNPLGFLNDLARGQTGGSYNVADERIPLYPTVPTGDEARALCEAVGLRLDALRRALSLGPGDFNAWMAGEKTVVDEMFPAGEIGAVGVRRVFGVIDGYAKATADVNREAAA